VLRARRERSLPDEFAALRQRLDHRATFHSMISKSPKMHAVFELIQHIATTNSTVLIEGETGTGKEQVARAIHQASSSVRPGRLVAVNCAALPEQLLESELFGHEKGSFTGAVSRRAGRFEMADRGTLFLDEIGEIPASMQAKLLRALQERCFERVGGTESVSVDVRIIAATNKPLLRMVEKGKFREDLYYRLNVLRLELPPLCERPEDIPILAAHFVQKYTPPGRPLKNFTPEAMQALLQYRWRGNVRELENVVERCCLTARGDAIRVEDLPPEVLAPAKTKSPFKVSTDRPLPEILRDAVAEIERQYICLALKKCRGNVGLCAKMSGLSRRSISSKLAEYKIDREAFKEAVSFDD
jgi:DNA-binding NtrC family response regulator